MAEEAERADGAEYEPKTKRMLHFFDPLESLPPFPLLPPLHLPPFAVFLDPIPLTPLTSPAHLEDFSDEAVLSAT